MKLKLFTVAALIFAMTSCGSKSEKEESASEVTGKTEMTSSGSSVDDSRAANDADSYADSDSNAGEEEVEDTAAASEVDDMLDEYENFVDKYVTLAKKAAKGDVSAVSSYASYMESAQSFGEKLERCASSMNAAQTKRYMDITNKLTSAASEIASDASASAAAMASQVDDAMDMLNNINF